MKCARTWLRKLGRLGVLKTGILALTAAVIMVIGAPSSEATQPQVAQKMVIKSDKGGRVSKYAIEVSHAKQQNTRIEIRGKCQSACTLYLSMPENQICITRGASFGFHKAHGSTRKLNTWGTDYLMANYPDWVVDWINSNGGLSKSMKRMSYRYAANHLPPCSKDQKKQEMVRNQSPRDLRNTTFYASRIRGISSKIVVYREYQVRKNR